METSDVDLVKLCLSGQDTAFDILVKRYQRAVYGLCYRMLGNAEDASDAAQESFVKAYNSLETFRHKLRFSAWLFRIAHNTCIDKLRKQSRNPTDSLEKCSECNSGEKSPEQALIDMTSERKIQEAISSLPEMQRAAMVMFHFNGMTISEIGHSLGRPEGTVKSDLHTAREKLRLKLKGLIDR